MEILEGIKIVDLGLWLEREQILVISDLHLGYEGEFEGKGILVPRFQLKDILGKLGEIFSLMKPKKIVINGDLKHNYGKILSQEWRDVLKLFDFMLKHCEEVVVVKGNHDLFLAPIIRKREVEVVNDYLVGEVLICHGDEVMEGRKVSGVKTLIIGHEHPAIVLEERGKREKYKCFLKGKWGGKDLVVMPSFNPFFEGTDVLRGEFLSPYLEESSGFEVYVVSEGKVLEFGKSKKLRKLIS